MVRRIADVKSVVVGLLAAGLGGCVSGERPETFRQETAGDMVRQELRADLDQFGSLAERTVRLAAERIEEQTPSRAERKAAVKWKLTMTRRYREALGNTDPVAALVDTWSLCKQMVDYFETGDGKDSFGDRQPIATAAARDLLDEIEKIAERRIQPARLPSMREQVAAHAGETPLRGDFSQPVAAQRLSRLETGRAMLNWIINVPLSPLGTLHRINETADAIRQATRVAARVAEIADDLPTNVRWQLQLLAMKIEEMESVRRALADFSKIADSAARLGRVSEDLPGRLHREADLLLASIDERHSQLRGTLAEANRTADAVQETAAGVAEAGRAWEATAKAVGAAAQEMGALKSGPGAASEPPAADAAEPFDINAYAATAKALEEATRELRGLTADVRGLLASDEVAERLGDMDARTRGITDHVAWRGAQLLGLAFVLAMLYGAASRWRHSRRPQ